MSFLSSLSQTIPVKAQGLISSLVESTKRFGVGLRTNFIDRRDALKTRLNSSQAPVWVCDESEVWLPLTADFRFIHEPLTSADSDLYIGRQDGVQHLALRIIRSRGGAFLVTGYRGVGKTSFILQTLHFVQESLPAFKKSMGHQELVVVHLNLARELTPAELMHHVMRRTYQALKNAKILKRLDKDLQELIRSAFERTSFNMTRKTGATTGSAWGISFPSIKVGDREIGSPLSWSRKKDKVMESQYSFLGYDDKMAEYDIIEILRRVGNGYKRFFRRKKVKIVFVFDELDKLDRENVQQINKKDTADKEAQEQPKRTGQLLTQPYLDKTLGILKNLFTTSGAVFIFVAGKDLQERWIRDISRGESIYQSVFAGNVYVQCLWEVPEELTKKLISSPSPAISSNDPVLKKFKGFLHYQSRGIPRKAFYEINKLVVWHEDGLRVSLKRIDLEKIDLFHHLDRIIQRYDKQIIGDLSKIQTSAIREDENRLLAYYLVDLILNMRKREFTIGELTELARQSLSERLMHTDDLKRIMGTLMEILVSENILVEVSPGRAAALNVDVTGLKQTQAYRLADWLLARLQDLVEVLPGELNEPKPFQETDFGIAHYELIQLIDTRHYYDIYKAVDRRNGQLVALKILKRSAPELAKEMLLQEIRILNRVKHPGIVKLVDYEDMGDDCYLATQFVDGEDLGRLVEIHPNGLEPAQAVAFSKEICAIVTYLHDAEIYRLDLKPSNILITKLGGVKLVDLGTAVDLKAENSDNWRTQTIGTPAYMAPELFVMPASADHRVDVFAFGILLYELLTGDTGIIEAEGVGESISSAQREFDFQTIEDVTLKGILEKCVNEDPNHRFQKMDEICPNLTNWQDFGQVSLKLQSVIGRAINDIKDAEQIEREWTDVSLGQLAQATPATVGLAPAEPILFKYIAVPQLDFLARPVAGDPPTLRLIPLDSSNIKFVMPPGQERAEIGRALSNDLVIKDTKVSRSHATLLRQNGLIMVKDNNSRLGTFINDERVRDRRIKDGDVLKFGTHEFRVKLDQDYEDISLIQTTSGPQGFPPLEPARATLENINLTASNLELVGRLLLEHGLPHLEDVDDELQAPFDERFLTLAKQLLMQGIMLEITEAAKNFLCASHNQALRKNRTPEQALEDLIEIPLADKLLANEFQAGDRIRADSENDKIIFERITNADPTGTVQFTSKYQPALGHIQTLLRQIANEQRDEE